MSSDLYALVALAARYWFVALMLVLLFRGWRMTVADNRRAKLLREWMGQTGCVGELIANPGAKKRVSYPIPREGVLGSGRSADVRIRHRDLKRAHAHFELREGGFLIRPLGSAQLTVGGGHTGEAVFLEDGDVLAIGRLELMLVLFDAPMEVQDEEDEWFEVAPDGAAYVDDEDGWYDGAYDSPEESEPYIRPARRDIPLNAEGYATEPAKARAPRKAGAGRRAKAAEAELPFSQESGRTPVRPAGRRVPAAGAARGKRKADGPEARAGGANAASRAARERAKPIDDFFDEDELWRDR